MAADGQVASQGTIVSNARQKLHRLPDGSLFGSSGRTIDGLAVARWLSHGGKPPKVEQEWTALQLMPSGQVMFWTDALFPVPIDAPAATGSGMDFALGAMLAGKSPRQAVAIACRLDEGSGGKICELRCK